MKYQPILLTPRSTPRRWLANDYAHFLLTSLNSPGTLGLFEAVVPPGGGNPPHTHNLEDESFYVLEGTLRFTVNDTFFDARAGDFIYAPRGSIHNFANISDSPARILISVTPSATFEAFAAECGAKWAGEDIPPQHIQQDAISRMVKDSHRFGLTILPNHKPTRHVACPSRNRAVNVLGDTVRLLTTPEETNQTFGVVEVTSRRLPEINAGGGPPPHIHPHEEAFYVLEGSLDVFSGETWHSLPAGHFAYSPSNALHTYRNSSTTPVRFLVYFTPANLTRMFEELGALSCPPHIPDAISICAKYQCLFAQR